MCRSGRDGVCAGERKRRMSNKIFDNICNKLKTLFQNKNIFICTKLTDYFMWIGCPEHEIAVQPVHYELRLGKNATNEDKIFVEVHLESESSQSTPIKQLCDSVLNLGLISVTTNEPNKAYFWYRNPDAEFDVDDSDENVKAIFKELEDLDKLVGPKIRKVIENKI